MEKYLHIRSGKYFCFKTFYLNWFTLGVRKLLHDYFKDGIASSILNLELKQQNFMIRLGNDYNRINVLSEKLHCETSTYILAISWNLQ